MKKSVLEIVDFGNFAAKRIEAARNLKEETLLEVAQEVAIRARTAELSAKHINRPYMWLRLLIVLGVSAVVGGIVWIGAAVNLEFKVKTWKEALEIGAQLAHMSLMIPLALSVILVERRLRRKRQLKEIAEIERLNDVVYAIQFDHNPGNENQKDLISFLDVCAGLLFLLRESAAIFARGVTDQIVLDRVGAVRRGCNDNHRNILSKMAMAMK